MPSLDLSTHRKLLNGMVEEYKAGRNMVRWASEYFLSEDLWAHDDVRSEVIGVAYDIQAGSYTDAVNANLDFYGRHWQELATHLNELNLSDFNLFEVGSGEASTLRGVLTRLKQAPSQILGCDLSFSRTSIAKALMASEQVRADFFVADLFQLPLPDDSIELVYTSHTLEPNGGREVEALRELLRVASKYVVLLEPAYEIASPLAQRRMRENNYVRDLPSAVLEAGGEVVDYKEYLSISPDNPAALITIRKRDSQRPSENPSQTEANFAFHSPVTGAPLELFEDLLVSAETYEAYPIVQGIPLLRGKFRLGWNSEMSSKLAVGW